MTAEKWRVWRTKLERVMYKPEITLELKDGETPKGKVTVTEDDHVVMVVRGVARTIEREEIIGPTTFAK